MGPRPQPSSRPRRTSVARMNCAVAIVGCAGRFPGAAGVPEFWQNLCDGVESVRTFAQSELQDGSAAEVRARPEYIKARAIVDGVADFDAGFFGMQAREAELTDPQHRVFLECCWQALEDAGYDPAAYRRVHRPLRGLQPRLVFAAQRAAGARGGRALHGGLPGREHAGAHRQRLRLSRDPGCVQARPARTRHDACKRPARPPCSPLRKPCRRCWHGKPT